MERNKSSKGSSIHLKKYNSAGCYTVATSKTRTGSYVKPGGALLYSDSEWAGRILKKGTDPWGYGKWAYQLYSGGTNKTLLTIAAYRVCKRNPENVGSTTAWYQQFTLTTALQHITHFSLTPYSLQMLCDHRGIMIDIDIKKLMQVTMQDLLMTAGRKLSTKHPNSEKSTLILSRRNFRNKTFTNA